MGSITVAIHPDDGLKRVQGGVCPNALVPPTERDCADCGGTGTVQHEREARLSDLTDRQLKFLVEATAVKEGTDEETQEQMQNQHGTPSPGGMTGGNAPVGQASSPHAVGKTEHHGNGSYTHHFDT